MNVVKLVGVSALLALSASVNAQNTSDWKSWSHASRISVGGGYFAPSLDTSLVVTDPDGIIGTGISFEKNLGLDDSKGTGLLYVDWRFAKKHSLQYRYFELKRSATATSSTVTIKVGGETFDLNLPIQSFFDITANEIAYAYSLLFDEKKNLSIGLGISVQDLALGIQGTATSPIPGEIINSNLDSTAPLPTLNIGFDYAFNDKWFFVSRLGWLAVELNVDEDEELSGEIINANVGVQWNAFEHVGFFAHYQIFDVNVDYLDNSKKFAVDYDYSGPLLGVEVRF